MFKICFKMLGSFVYQNIVITSLMHQYQRDEDSVILFKIDVDLFCFVAIFKHKSFEYKILTNLFMA